MNLRKDHSKTCNNGRDPVIVLGRDRAVQIPIIYFVNLFNFYSYLPFFYYIFYFIVSVDFTRIFWGVKLQLERRVLILRSF